MTRPFGRPGRPRHPPLSPLFYLAASRSVCTSLHNRSLLMLRCYHLL